MLLRSASERRWWIAVAVTLGGIYLSLYPLQFALDALRERNLLRKSIAASAIFVAVGLATWLKRRRAGWREWSALAACAAFYALVAARLDIVQERIHLLQYGLVALLALGALEARAAAGDGGRVTAASSAAAAAGALLLTAAAGWLDEAIQGVLPNRHYDLRDVGLNALAGAMALGAAALLRRARAADLRSAA